MPRSIILCQIYTILYSKKNLSNFLHVKFTKYIDYAHLFNLIFMIYPFDSYHPVRHSAITNMFIQGIPKSCTAPVTYVDYMPNRPQSI